MKSGAMWRTSYAPANSSVDPVIVLSPVSIAGEVVDFVIIAANETAERLMSGADTSIVGTTLTDVPPTVIDTSVIDKAVEIMSSGRPQRLEMTLCRHHEREWELTCLPCGDLLMVSARDVTEVRERARVRIEIEALKRVTAERKRVARDLHDNVIQQVIGASMELARLASWAEDTVAGELEHVIAIHDHIVRDLRSILYGLQRPTRDVRKEILAFVDQGSGALGLTPEVCLGSLDAVQGHHLEAAHLLLALREALSNIARHARAERVWVSVDASDGQLSMTVDDDGCGISDRTPHGNGLANLKARASLLGGECKMSERPGGGTRVQWSVPLTITESGGQHCER